MSIRDTLYAKLQSFSKGLSVEEIAKVDYCAVKALPELSKDERTMLSYAFGGMIKRLRDARRRELVEAEKAEMVSRLISSGVSVSSAEAVIAVDEIFKARTQNGDTDV